MCKQRDLRTLDEFCDELDIDDNLAEIQSVEFSPGLLVEFYRHCVVETVTAEVD